MRWCSRCKTDKPDEAFTKSARWCRPCVKAYDAERWKKRPDIEKHKQRTKERRVELHKWMNDIKSNIPCTDCRLKWPPYVTDWDHLPGAIKIDTISNMIRTGRKVQAEAEMKKCELVCANCHRIRTFQRRGVV